MTGLRYWSDGPGELKPAYPACIGGKKLLAGGPPRGGIILGGYCICGRFMGWPGICGLAWPYIGGWLPRGGKG